MEKFDQNPIESKANYEGNATELQFKRIANEKIRKQLLDLLFIGCNSNVGKTFEIPEEDENGKPLKDEAGEIIYKTVPYLPITMEELESSMDEAIDEVIGSTEISFNPDTSAMTNSDVIEMNWIAPWNNKKANEKQLSIIEAHEKGHRVRRFNAPYFDTYFSSAFSFDQKALTKGDVIMFSPNLTDEQRNEEEEEIRDFYIKYLSQPTEIAERMSQLKNYFGMEGDEEFTLEHLNYAKEHYIVDTGMDNAMRVFFDAIKLENEEEFIRLINCSGI